VEIKINDKYSITTDPMNVILQENKTFGSESKNAGEEYKDTIGYFANLQQAHKKLLDYEIMTSDLSDVKEICDCMERLHEDFKQAFNK